MNNITADEYSLLEFISSRDKREDNSRILLEQTKKILKSLVRKGFGRIEHYSAIGDWFTPDWTLSASSLKRTSDSTSSNASISNTTCSTSLRKSPAKDTAGTTFSTHSQSQHGTAPPLRVRHLRQAR